MNDFICTGKARRFFFLLLKTPLVSLMQGAYYNPFFFSFPLYSEAYLL